MKIYSIWRGGGGEEEGAFCGFFSFFSWPSWPWLQPEEGELPCPAAEARSRGLLAVPITPPQACPVAAAMTIALATVRAGDAMHHRFIKEQRLHSTAVFFQSNSISLEQ